MKILILSHQFYPDVGGIEVNSEVLSLQFHQAGHQVRLITWTREEGEKTFPFPVIRHPQSPQLLKQHAWADVIFENNPCLRLSWPAMLLNKPCVVAINTWISRIDGRIAWQDRLKTAWLRTASAVIAVSSAIRAKSFENAIVIGNPYRSDLFEIQTHPSERELDFVFVGRLVSDKGADLAIRGLRKFIDFKREKDPAFTTSLTIIGDGPDAQELRALTRKLNLAGNVFFTGFLSGQQLVSSLNLHKFLLVPSIWEEPFGNVVLEGMGCGLIPIVASGGGLVDAAGKAGLIFESGNVDDMVLQMARIYDDECGQIQLRAEAEPHLRRHHAGVVSKKYLRVLENAAGL